MSSEEETVDTAKSWENAQAYAALLGNVPSSFSSTVRTLVNEHDKNNRELSYQVASRCERLLKGPKTRSMFYFGSLTFRESTLRGRDEVTLRDLVLLYEAFDIASMIAMIYLYRRVRHLCKEDAGWDELSNKLQKFGELGGYVGNAIPAIGLGTGMLIGSIRYIALATLLHHDNNGFNMYMKHLDSAGGEADFDFELKRWNCSSLQIASVIMQSIGYGVDIPKGIVFGLDPAVEIENIIEDAPYRIKIAEVWMHSLIDSGEQPSIPMRGNYYPLKEDYEDLKRLSSQVISSGPRFNWLEVDEDDVENATNPFLRIAAARVKTTKTAAEGAQPRDEAQEELLADLEKDIDALLDDG